MPSKYVQVTDVEEAWALRQAGLLLARRSYGNGQYVQCPRLDYFDEHRFRYDRDRFNYYILVEE